MAILDSNAIKAMTKGQTVTGVAFLREYSIAKTKNGADFFNGSILCGDSVAIKAWNNSQAFAKLNNSDLSKQAIIVSGKIDDFGGSNSLVLDDVTVPTEKYNEEDFLASKYDTTLYMNTLKTQAQKLISAKGFAILDEMLFSNAAVSADFVKAFAAKSHHDNCKGGLLAHSFKTFSTTAFIVNTYKNIVNGDTDIADLLYIGAIMHDIGKIWEMKLGAYTPESIVTHRYLGMEYIARYKDKIIAAYSDMWYYNLASIILQHHDEYGEPCKTLYAKIINVADNFDATLTTFNEGVTDGTGKIRWEDKILEY